MGPDGEERFLNHVVDLGAVAEQTTRQSLQQVAPVDAQLTHRIFRARPNPAQDIFQTARWRARELHAGLPDGREQTVAHASGERRIALQLRLQGAVFQFSAEDENDYAQSRRKERPPRRKQHWHRHRVGD
jgi:hypothetical protein